jgi:peptide/nickel transport system substrate-binding protein
MPGALLARCLVLAAFVGLLGAYEPHVLTYADGGDISSLNPFIATEGNAPAYSELTMAEFVRFDAHGNPVPELITEIPTRANGGISRDGKTITYHLRRGVKWSDGQLFSSDDVTFSVAVAKDDRNDLYVRDPWDRITSVSAPDKYTVIFHLKAPYSAFIEDYFSTQSSSCVLPKHVVGPGTQINQSPYNSLPVGIGPFRYAAYKRGDSVVMEANPYYWRGQPKLTRVIYKMITDQNTLMTQLQTGEIDLWPTINGPLMARAKALPGKQSASRLTNFVGGIFFNVAKPQVSDRVVREALRLATDRNTLFDKVVHRNGVIVESLVPRTSVDWADLPVTRLDPDAAARMLDADGWKLGPDGIRHKNGIALTLDLAIPSGYQPSEIFAAILKEDWAKIGVGVTIHIWALPQFFAPYSNGGIIQTGRFDAGLFSTAPGPIFANINGYYDCASIPPRGGNADRYCSHEVDSLDDRYLSSYDPHVRHEVAAEMQRLLDKDAPAIAIYERTYLSVFDARLTGYHPNSFSFWGDPMEMDI